MVGMRTLSVGAFLLLLAACAPEGEESGGAALFGPSSAGDAVKVDQALEACVRDAMAAGEPVRSCQGPIAAACSEGKRSEITQLLCLEREGDAWSALGQKLGVDQTALEFRGREPSCVTALAIFTGVGLQMCNAQERISKVQFALDRLAEGSV